MKSRINPVIALVGIVLGCGLFWWVGRPYVDSLDAEKTPAASPTTSTPTAITPAPIAPAHAPEVAAPAVKAVPVPQLAAQSDAAAAKPDPRLNPDTAIADFNELVDSGFYGQAAETYCQIPPNLSGQQFVDQLQQDPGFPQLVQMVQDTMRAAQGVAPTYNDAGDQATYTFPNKVDDKAFVRWKKVDGVWKIDAIE